MKKYFLFIFFAMLFQSGFSQTKPKQKPKSSSQSEIDKMMKEAEEMMNDLSPEEKKMMGQGMQQMKQMNNNGSSSASSGISTKIPAKHTATLAAIPKLSNSAQYSSFVESLRLKALKTIPATLISKVDALLNQQKANAQAINNLAPALFLNKNPKASVYAAIRAAQMNRNNPIPQNNLCVILHQAGYPQYAVPLLEYLLIQNNIPVLLNNAGQCYLSLGEKEKAKFYFLSCLKLDPNHAEANCGTALLLCNEGKIAEATPYIHKAFKNSYSEVLEKLTEEKKIKLDFEQLKPTVPDYFNPQKYKPVPAAKTLAEIKPILTQREEMNALVTVWQEKQQQADDEQGNKINNENSMQHAARIYGFFPNVPFGKKAKFMILQNGKSVYDWYVQHNRDNFENYQAARELHADLDRQIAQIYKDQKFESVYEECKIKVDLVNNYLLKSAAYHEAYVRKTVHKHYDYTNQQLHWYRFLLNEEQYKQMYYGVVTEFMTQIANYSKWQLLGPTPDYVVTTCEKILQNPPEKQVADEIPEADCPIKIKIPFGFGSYKEDCKGMEIEGGELLALGFEKNYSTGEFTVAFGLGEQIELGALGAGAKGQLFFKFGKDISAHDCGMKFEAGAEATFGPLVREEKITATLGMTSGVNLDAVNGGRELKIFQADPSKDYMIMMGKQTPSN